MYHNHVKYNHHTSQGQYMGHTAKRNNKHSECINRTQQQTSQQTTTTNNEITKIDTNQHKSLNNIRKGQQILSYLDSFLITTLKNQIYE